LDNGAFHHSKQLIIPDNIALLFIPPYSPELNPAECMWRYIKGKIANRIFESLNNLSDSLAEIINDLNNKIVKSITGWTLYNKCIY